MKNNRTGAVLLATIFISTLSTNAFGYIDGGTGSMMLQAALSGLLGAVFVFKSFWSNVRKGKKENQASRRGDA